MVIIDNKILDPITTIQDLTRKPTPDGMTYTALQAKFDESPEVLRQKHNSLIDDVILLDNKNIKDNGNQTIAGVKTFLNSPVIPTPTTDYHASTKKYTDDVYININDKISNINSIIGDERYLSTGQICSDIYNNTNDIDTLDAKINSNYSELNSALNTHKSSGDHDSRYYTKSQADLFHSDLENMIIDGDAQLQDTKLDKTTYNAQVINAGNSNSEVVDARGTYSKMKDRLDNVDSSLADKTTYADFYRKPKTGKKIAMTGDSTTEIAPAMYTRFGLYTALGGLLEGAIVYNRGQSGGTLNQFVNNTTANGYTLNNVIAMQCDLYILCYGINDIRDGSRTKAQILADLKIAIDRLLNETDGYILLRTPNTFITYDPNGFVVPIENAQLYSDQLFEIYESLRGYDRRVDVIDIASRVFGKQVLATHPYMLNSLHPNDSGYIAITDEIAEYISSSKRELKLTTQEIILKGNIESIDTTAKTITFTTISNNTISIGDIVYIGDNAFTIIDTPTVVGMRVTIKYYSSNNVDKYGVVYVVSKKSNLPSTISESQTTKNKLRTWNKVNVTKPNTNPIYFHFAIPIGSLGWNTAKNYQVDYDFYTKSAIVNGTYAHLWYNNDPTAIVGGSSYQYGTVGVSMDATSHYQRSASFNMNTYTYLHILIAVTNSAIGDINFELGNLTLLADGVNVDLSGATKSLYNPDAGAKLLNNLLGGDYLSTYRDMIAELQYRNII